MLQSLKKLEVVRAGREPTPTLEKWHSRWFRVGGMDFEAGASDLEGAAGDCAVNVGEEIGESLALSGSQTQVAGWDVAA